MSDRVVLCRSSRVEILEMVSSFQAILMRSSILSSTLEATELTRGSSSEKAKTRSVNVTTSWSTWINDMRRRGADCILRIKPFTAARQASSSLTCDSNWSMNRGASTRADLTLWSKEATFPAAPRRPTTDAVMLRGSILDDARETQVGEAGAESIHVVFQQGASSALCEKSTSCTLQPCARQCPSSRSAVI